MFAVHVILDKIEESCDSDKDLNDVQDKEMILAEGSTDKIDKVDVNEEEDSSLGNSKERAPRESEHVQLEEQGRRSSRTPKPRVVYFAELPPVSHAGHANNSNHNQHSSSRSTNNSSNNTIDDSHTNEDGDDDNEMPDSQSGLGSALPAVRKFFSTRLEQVVTFLGGHTCICHYLYRHISLFYLRSSSAISPSVNISILVYSCSYQISSASDIISVAANLLLHLNLSSFVLMSSICMFCLYPYSC